MKSKKLLTGVLTMIITFTAASIPININAAENSALTASKLDSLAYKGNDLGAVYTPQSTTFKVWAPTAAQVKLKLYTTGSDAESDAQVISEQEMDYSAENGIWSLKANGNLKNVYYTYLVTANGTTNETVDIYAKAVGVNGDRGMVVDLADTNPKNWESDKSIATVKATDAIVWEVHVKDFSNSETSGVSLQNRGKYLAFTEDNTTVNGSGDIPTCVNYLKQLGVNYVQINPFYDFSTVDEAGADDQFNWGYDPKNYNVPEGSYSSNPYDGNVRINEVKQMVQALHNAGIGVIMDVVYNHTMFNETSWFSYTVPNYYYRIAEDGTWSNGSGCGNDTASEHAMYSKFMVDSVTYWAKEYHLDGFRFDLMGLHDVNTMNAIRESLDTLENGENIIMYGEAWSLNTNTNAVLATQANMNMLSDRIAAFNDDLRDSLRGNNFATVEKGALQGKGGAIKLQNGIIGATNQWAKQPSQTVSYQSCHDNLTLYDKLVGSVIGTDSNYRQRYDNLVEMNKLGSAVVLTSQGISFMLAGEEMARSKDGDENSFKSPAAVNEIDWNNLQRFPDLTAYYAGLIQIRKSFAPFTDATNTTKQNIHFVDDTDNKIMAYIVDNALTDNTQWKKVACIFNISGSEEKQVTLTGQDNQTEWVIVANNEKAGLKSLGTVNGNTITIPKSSAMILVDKESFNNCNLQGDTQFLDTLASLKPIDNQLSQAQESNQDNKDSGSKANTIPLIIGGAVAVAGAITGGIVYSKKRKKRQ